MINTAQHHVINVEPDYMGEMISSDVILFEGFGPLRNPRNALGHVPRGAVGRKEVDGEVVPGPWLYYFGLAGVLAANPEEGTYGEMKRKQSASKVHTIEPGDTVEFDGYIYSVHKSTRLDKEVEFRHISTLKSV